MYFTKNTYVEFSMDESFVQVQNQGSQGLAIKAVDLR